jgi:hypothetical protein
MVTIQAAKEHSSHPHHGRSDGLKGMAGIVDQYQHNRFVKKRRSAPLKSDGWLLSETV